MSSNLLLEYIYIPHPYGNARHEIFGPNIHLISAGGRLMEFYFDKTTHNCSLCDMLVASSDIIESQTLLPTRTKYSSKLFDP